MDLEVRVPATVANLGPGFDCLGVAIGRHLAIRVAEASETVVTGKGPPRRASDSLTVRAFNEAFNSTDASPPTVEFEVVEDYPSARGMGASASAIVAGLVAARQTGDLPLEDTDLARLAIRIEGHSDNVLAALFGGLVLSSREGWMRFEPTRRITPVILVAREKFKTEEARRALPAEIPRADAVANSAATAALVAALTGNGPTEALLLATEDRVHEPYRLPLMPESMDLHDALRGKGVATALAGAGPSLICLTESDSLIETTHIIGDLLPDGWQILTPGWDLEGAKVR